MTEVPASTIRILVEQRTGDFDGNGAIGDGDLTLLLANWGKTVPSVPVGWVYDRPTAPNVGDEEFTKLLSTWGQGSATSMLVPEPTAVTVVAVGPTMAMLRGARRRND